MIQFLCVALTTLFLFQPVFARQDAGLVSQLPAEPIVTTEVLFSFDRVHPGSDLRVAVIGHIAPGWHVNSNKPSEEFLIPTELDKIPNVHIGQIVYPAGVTRQFEFSETPLSVYDEKVVVGVLVQVPENPDRDSLEISGMLKYQACNDFSCLAPTEVPFRASIAIAQLSQPNNLINLSTFEGIGFSAISNHETNDEIGALVAKHGLGVSLIFILLGGLALNLTPCVYPLIPITVSFFGGQTSGQTGKMFGLSLVYILGMAMTYSILGVVAASSGALFGAALQNPIVIVGMAAIMVALSLSMFGVYELQVPQSLMQLAGGSRQGFAGAFLMGLTVGIVAAPCIGPFVLALLTYVGASGDPVMGFWMFFALALGLGLPYLFLGTFSGLLHNLPRSGVWMVWVKKVFGVILLAMAGYFLKPILPEMAGTLLVPIILIAGGIYLGFVGASKFDTKIFALLKRAVAVAFIGVAVWLVWPDREAHAGNWTNYTQEALELARRDGRPVIIDFSADWCLACKELEKLTFPHEEVQARSQKFVFLRADLTQYGSEPVRRLREQFGIKGLPTVVFLNASGDEVKDQRVVGFVDGDEFARRMDRVMSTGNEPASAGS